MGTKIQKIIRDFMIQMGDVETKYSKGDSIYGRSFNDESFALSHNRAGWAAGTSSSARCWRAWMSWSRFSSRRRTARTRHIARFTSRTAELTKSPSTHSQRNNLMLTVMSRNKHHFLNLS